MVDVCGLLGARAMLRGGEMLAWHCNISRAVGPVAAPSRLKATAHTWRRNGPCARRHDHARHAGYDGRVARVALLALVGRARSPTPCRKSGDIRRAPRPTQPVLIGPTSSAYDLASARCGRRGARHEFTLPTRRMVHSQHVQVLWFSTCARVFAGFNVLTALTGDWRKIGGLYKAP